MKSRTPSPAAAPALTLFDADGRARKSAAHALRVQLPDGRSLTIDLSQAADGVVALVAEHTDTRQQAGLLVRPDNHDALAVAITATPQTTTTGTPASPPALELEVQTGEGIGKRAGLPPRRRIETWVKSALYADATLTLRFVGEEEGRALNRSYRGKDYATNVLTFAYAESVDDPVTADIVLCCPVVEAEAREQGKPLEAHYAHLIVHGVLHAQGYEHEDDAEAEEMEAIETETLQALGYADPYRSIRD
ncbi:rRNA maturation RNase YbeY [Cupriavidus sp. USMAA2-4]|uniref:Endoribonuclease YbeY n=1 Tax=Cupriavidus malaysiensis TaxID=367825 RepID=A0ABM6F182_9BURK|nr:MULTISPECIES: rRNA maturation RNase YbeY [Cupriavidus]AOY91734.1 rRNA maturation RNase YbeY [Cupriavidus sp. USMAA2-4]AOY98708.1 rRNA maturation RNase YbeY [Cupriavidus sp. USMAHM13]AOZ05138.1 rRNA maturation RNase YbeY [Cupriavidus malaysiensis]